MKGLSRDVALILTNSPRGRGYSTSYIIPIKDCWNKGEHVKA